MTASLAIPLACLVGIVIASIVAVILDIRDPNRPSK